MTFSLAFPVMLGVTALAVDSASFYDQHSRMQSVADSSALAVAKELHVYRKNIAELKAVGQARVETLLAEAGIAGRPHTSTVDIDGETNVVTVGISMVSETLVPVEVWGENPIVVSSQAHAYGQNRLCVLALHDTKSDTIKADGTASMAAPDCAVQSNSKDPAGLNVSSNAKIVSTVICSAGGTTGSGSFTPKPETDCPRLDDPLAARPAPKFGGCDFVTKQTFKKDGVITATNVPTVFCGGLTIEGGATVQAQPGTYVILGGKLEVKDGSKLIGENVGFYFADDSSTFTFSKTSTINLTAPKSGEMAGILFFENRLSVLGRTFTINSQNAKQLLGTIYLPKGTLKVDVKASVAGESAYTVIVARQLDVKDAALVINSDYGGTDVPVPDGVGPNSRMVMLNR
jgi:Flp pilus assembly protein TadG